MRNGSPGTFRDSLIASFLWSKALFTGYLTVAVTGLSKHSLPEVSRLILRSKRSWVCLPTEEVRKG